MHRTRAAKVCFARKISWFVDRYSRSLSALVFDSRNPKYICWNNCERFAFCSFLLFMGSDAGSAFCFVGIRRTCNTEQDRSATGDPKFGVTVLRSDGRGVSHSSGVYVGTYQRGQHQRWHECRVTFSV